MTIGIIMIIVILIAIYYGIRIYIYSKNNMIIYTILILLFSIGLEFRSLNLGNYIFDVTYVFRNIRDIIRTILTIILFRKIYMV